MNYKMSDIIILIFATNLKGSENMQYCIVLFPSNELTEEANAYRMRYDSESEIIPPHIKLDQPFEADEQFISELSSRLKLIASTTKEFTVTVNKISTLFPQHDVLCYKVNPSTELVELHKNICKELPCEIKNGNFIPHIIIGQNLSHDEQSDVLAQIKMDAPKFEESFSSFSLLRQNENEKWEILKSYQFGC
jgi:2'-5' RNA ligase